MHAPAAAVAAAAVRLARAGCWNAADRLLEAAEPDGVQEAAALALARLEVAAEGDLFRGGAGATDERAHATALVEAAADPLQSWDLALLQVRQQYIATLRRGGGDADGTLAARARDAHVAAPDRNRAGWAAFYRGVIADNLAGDGTAAQELYELALTAARESGDDLLTSYALRHLGGHAEERGDLSKARELAERSAELRARAGFVPGVLAQQVILASLAAAEGDVRAARAIATEVRRWADALELRGIGDQARTLLV